VSAATAAAVTAAAAPAQADPWAEIYRANRAAASAESIAALRPVAQARRVLAAADADPSAVPAIAVAPIAALRAALHRDDNMRVSEVALQAQLACARERMRRTHHHGEGVLIERVAHKRRQLRQRRFAHKCKVDLTRKVLSSDVQGIERILQEPV
jgi:hypothetical protein